MTSALFLWGLVMLGLGLWFAYLSGRLYIAARTSQTASLMYGGHGGWRYTAFSSLVAFFLYSWFSVFPMFLYLYNINPNNYIKGFIAFVISLILADVMHQFGRRNARNERAAIKVWLAEKLSEAKMSNHEDLTR